METGLPSKYKEGRDRNRYLDRSMGSWKGRGERELDCCRMRFYLFQDVSRLTDNPEINKEIARDGTR